MLNALRTAWYRMKYQWILRKAVFGPRVRISCRLEVVGVGRVEFGPDCQIGPDPWGRDHVTIYFSAPGARVVLGRGVVLRGTRMGARLSITVADGAVIEACSLFDTDYHHVDASRREEDVSHRNRPVVVGPGSYIGLDAICSKGTALGQGVILLPGTVVGTRQIPDGTMLLGNPPQRLSRSSDVR